MFEDALAVPDDERSFAYTAFTSNHQFVNKPSFSMRKDGRDLSPFFDAFLIFLGHL
jgi:hypothetical protein